MVKAKLIQSDPFAPLFIPTHEKSLKFLWNLHLLPLF
jgi:hypothetical protein